MNYLQLILTIIGTAAEAAQGVSPTGEAQDAEKAAAALTRIAQAAITAHEQITGQPIDLTKLTPLPPVQ